MNVGGFFLYWKQVVQRSCCCKQNSAMTTAKFGQEQVSPRRRTCQMCCGKQSVVATVGFCFLLLFEQFIFPPNRRSIHLTRGGGKCSHTRVRHIWLCVNAVGPRFFFSRSLRMPRGGIKPCFLQGRNPCRRMSVGQRILPPGRRASWRCRLARSANNNRKNRFIREPEMEACVFRSSHRAISSIILQTKSE